MNSEKVPTEKKLVTQVKKMQIGCFKSDMNNSLIQLNRFLFKVHDTPIPRFGMGDRVKGGIEKSESQR